MRSRRGAHAPPSTHPQRPPRRVVLPADRAGAVAHLLAGRHREPRPWRVLRHRRVPRDHHRAAAGVHGRRLHGPGARWASSASSSSACCCGASTRPIRALSLLLTFGLAMVIEQAAAHDLRRAAALVGDPAGAARPVHRRRLLLSQVPRAADAWSRSCASPASGSCCSARPSAASCAPACRTRTWWARSASRSSPTWRRSPSSASASRGSRA